MVSIEKYAELAIRVSAHWRHELNSTYVRRSEDVLDVFLTYYVRSIYVLYPVGEVHIHRNDERLTQAATVDTTDRLACLLKV